MDKVTQFYTLAHIFISFIGAVLLMAIWYHISKRFKQLLEEDDSEKRLDKGLLHLSLAMMVWVVSGVWALFFRDSGAYQIGVHLLSTANNLFLILALFYFSHAPRFISQNQKNVPFFMIGIAAVTGITVLLSALLGTDFTYNGMNVSGLPDLAFSGFLSYLLIVSFYRTFTYRNLYIVALISVAAILLMFASQLPEVFGKIMSEFNKHLIKLVAKTSLIAIVLVLATSWVIRLASMPKPNEMAISFRDWSLVKLSIPSKGVYDQTVDFGSKTTQYKNLLKFAIRRKAGEGQGQSMEVGGNGEVKSQTYLSRIIDNINEILDLPEDSKLERRDLFTFIGNGRYRLRMVPDHISFDASLLQEFSESTDSQAYKELCNKL